LVDHRGHFTHEVVTCQPQMWHRSGNNRKPKTDILTTVVEQLLTSRANNVRTQQQRSITDSWHQRPTSNSNYLHLLNSLSEHMLLALFLCSTGTDEQEPSVTLAPPDTTASNIRDIKTFDSRTECYYYTVVNLQQNQCEW